jgi:hypothetical protein
MPAPFVPRARLERRALGRWSLVFIPAVTKLRLHQHVNFHPANCYIQTEWQISLHFPHLLPSNSQDEINDEASRLVELDPFFRSADRNAYW